MTMKTIPTKVVRHQEPVSADHYYREDAGFLDEYESFAPVDIRWTDHVTVVEVLREGIDVNGFSRAFGKQWCSFVDRVTFDFSSNLKMNLTLLDDELNPNNQKLIRTFCEAIAEYLDDRQFENKLAVSVEAARNYLYLLPTLGNHLHRVSIDADTGFINVGFKSRHKETLTVLVTSGAEVHYSLIGRRNQLVKISGTAKIRDKHDYFVFEKVLRML